MAENLTPIEQNSEAISEIKTLVDGLPEKGGATDEQYELINEITLTEDVEAISLSVDKDGNAFSLKNAMLYFWNSIGSGGNYGAIQVLFNDGRKIFVANALNSARNSIVVLRNERGKTYGYGWWTFGTDRSVGGGETIGTSWQAQDFIPVTSISASTSDVTNSPLKSGGKITLWGIKA